MGHLKIIKSGDYIELFNYEREINPKIKSGRRKRVKQRDSRPLASRHDSIRRRIKSFSRLVRANLVGETSPSLFTLTCVESVGIVRGYEYLADFWRRLRQASISVEKYIAVPEFQKRGAIHFHLIVWGMNEYAKQERDSRQIQNIWQRGFVDCVQTDGHEKLVGYLAKYMRKSMYDSRLVGQKAYTSSRSCMRSMSISSPLAFKYAFELWGVDLSTAIPLQEKQFDTQWLGKGRFRLFKV